MSTIFVSYRRTDTADITGRIRDHLAAHFGEENVFTDVHSIRAGMDVPGTISSAIATCHAALIVIGPGWLDADDGHGGRRLDDSRDLVRREVEAALQGGTLAIPLLVGGAGMPAPESLPAPLRPLADRHAIHIRPDPDFQHDIARLIAALKPRHPRPLVPLPRAIVACLGIVAVGAALYPWPWSQDEGRPASGTDSPSVAPPISTRGEVDTSPWALVQARVPYDPGFLGPIAVPLPVVTESLGAPLDGQVFDYIHYSLVMNEWRAMPLYTAANLDRSTRVRPQGAEHWMLDPRIPAGVRSDASTFENNQWDRGHLVDRSSVTWGDAGLPLQASRAAYFYSNATPQHVSFNQGVWAHLEDYVLRGLSPGSTRLSIFAGPVNRADDYDEQGVRIPRSFWKIVAANDPADPRTIRVYAYLVDQYTLDGSGGIVPLPRVRAQDFDPAKYQVSVARIESLTPLRFGVLKDFDIYVPRPASGR